MGWALLEKKFAQNLQRFKKMFYLWRVGGLFNIVYIVFFITNLKGEKEMLDII
jgi:muconolactone delta-isomerase